MNKVLKQKIFSVSNDMTSGAKQSGFTLIEIAIVLVIIGLLLGGVMKGQELINTARVRALSSNIDGVTSAWFSFQDRYRAFPGDYSQATVNLPAVSSGTIVDGDGTGQVGVTGAGVDSPAERANVWLHLQAAGYITGAYDGGNIVVGAYDCSLATCPDNGFGNGMVVSRGALQQSGGAAAHELLSGRAIPSDVLAELDRKIDDGTPSAGSMQLGTASTGWGNSGEIPLCLGGSANVYNMQTPSDNCAAVFRNF